MASRKEKYKQHCIELARKSSHNVHRHGAILVRGPKIISTGTNHSTFNSLAARFHPVTEHASLHAEIACILGIDRSELERSDLYVLRLNRQEKIALSKPCPVCQRALEHVGIRRVFYSDQDGNWLRL
jgi:tRNA(Arg) A34 adenosine deaminase TadA